MSASPVKSPPQCKRCGREMQTAGLRGLCLSCLSATTVARFSAAAAEAAVEDLRLEEGITLGPNDRFLLHDKLGAGGMGEVWLAADQELSRDDEPFWVALKFLSANIRNNKSAVAAVRNEVIRSQELNHPNIVRVFDIHSTRKGMPFIKMEYVRGNSLSYCLQDAPHGVMRWKDVVNIAQQLCGALQYAHEMAGVIHRDIKPGTLLFRSDRILKIADFGIAEALYTTRAASLKKSGLGTLWYASPQQISGQKPTPSDDIHAVGATLYELLTGTPPFLGDSPDVQGDSTEVLIHQVRYDLPEPIRDRLAKRGVNNEVPDRLANLISRCLEKEPQSRPLAREILAQLQAPSAPPATQAAAPVSPAETSQNLPPIPQEVWEASPIPEPSRRSGWWAAAAILLLAAGAYFIDFSALRNRFFTSVGATTNSVAIPTKPVVQPKEEPAAQPEVVKFDPPPQTPEPAAPVVFGTLLVDLSSFARDRPNVPRDLVFEKVGSDDIRRFSLPKTEPRKFYNLPEGDYKVSLLEQNGWRLIENASVGHKITNVVRFVNATARFKIRADPPDALIALPEGITAKTRFYGEAGPFFRVGTFPVWVSKAGFIQDPNPELVTIKPSKAGEDGLLVVRLRPVEYPVNGLQTFTNSLGMVFREIGDLWVCENETRVSDFRSFCDRAKYDATKGMFSVTPDGFKQVGLSWIDPGPVFAQTEDRPVIGVNWNDAVAFCEWLTREELARHRLRPNQKYTLPHSTKWMELAGNQAYPWGNDDLGLRGGKTVGNYSGIEVTKTPGWPATWPILRNCDDGYPRTAPVAAEFARGANNLFHMGGNAAEWCMNKVLCGGSWADGEDGPNIQHFECLKTKVVNDQIPADARHDRNGFRVIIVEDSQRASR